MIVLISIKFILILFLSFFFLVLFVVFRFCKKGPAHIKRATTDKLREIFQKYASQKKNGEYFMTTEDFIRGYLGLFPESNHNKVIKGCEIEMALKM